MEPVVLHNGSPPDALERAVEVMAVFLQALCHGAASSLELQRAFLLCCEPLVGERAVKPKAWEVDMADVTRTLRRLGRVGRRPQPHARRELNRLMVLVTGVPFEHLVVAPDSVSASLVLPAPEETTAPGTAIEICIPSPGHNHTPVFIRKPTPAGGEHLFIQPARHGACRGEAGPLLETAVERLDLSGLILVALSWARRNL